MAITVSSMTSIAMFNQGLGVHTATQGSQTGNALLLASQRMGQKLDSANVQLSSMGQISSGFANLQVASKALASPAKTATSADIVSAVQNFATAFNAATKTVSTALNGAGNGAGVLANDIHVRFASNDLKGVLSSGSNTADLNKIGVSMNKDGTLSVNTKTLQSAIQANPNAVNDTLAKIGQQAAQVSAKDLAGTGNVGGAVNSLSASVKALQSQSVAQQKLASGSLTVQSPVANIGNMAGSLASYMQIFSL